MTSKLFTTLVLTAALSACSSGSADTRVQGNPGNAADLTLESETPECYRLTQSPDAPVVITTDASELIQPSFPVASTPAPNADATAATSKDVLAACE